MSNDHNHNLLQSCDNNRDREREGGRQAGKERKQLEQIRSFGWMDDNYDVV